MKKRYPRNIKANFCPEVSTDCMAQRVVVTTGGFKGLQRYNVTADMSVTTAKNLILNLRKALREIRDVNIQRLNAAVAAAEAEL